MDCFQITGGVSLSGKVGVGGAKNAALPIMAAAIMIDGPTCLAGIPRLRDVRTLQSILIQLGMDVSHDASGAMRLNCVDPTETTAPYRLVRRMRAGFCVLGPLLARRGEAVVPLPGGCNLGHRPIDLHLAGLSALGATFRIERGNVTARADRLIGTDVNMTGPRGASVTGTANLLCAATLAEGVTRIFGAAKEPEIVDLGLFLVRAGACVTGLGTSTLVVEGKSSLAIAPKNVPYEIIPDRIEAATLLMAAMITGGSVQVTGARAEHLESILETLRAAGARIETEHDAIRLTAPKRPACFHVEATPFPGIPTDTQPLFVALAAAGYGRSVIRDEVFPERWMHLEELTRMGAKIERAGASAIVEGVGDRLLRAAPVAAHDLRGGAASVLAALAARGTSTIQRVEHIDRGYERLEEKLARLGAQIERQSSKLRSTVCKMPPLR